MGIEDLRHSPMMSHLIDALDRQQDIGHYGRLVFIMIARHLLNENEVLAYLTKDPDCDEQRAD
jgi:hypothetical protein